MNKVITVSREFGSGGRELGVKLAEALGIPFYDKELISMAADDINIAEEAFRKYDEHVIEDDPLDHKIHHSFSELYKVPMSDQIFVAQSNVIRRLASHGPCVIVGRCADMILEDSVNIFIYSKMKQRVKRLMELEPEEGRAGEPGGCAGAVHALRAGLQCVVQRADSGNGYLHGGGLPGLPEHPAPGLSGVPAVLREQAGLGLGQLPG